jgi:hypothetical protein
MVAIVVGLAQIPSGEWTTAGGSAPLTPPAAQVAASQAPTDPANTGPASPDPKPPDQATSAQAPTTAPGTAGSAGNTAGAVAPPTGDQSAADQSAAGQPPSSAAPSPTPAPSAPAQSGPPSSAPPAASEPAGAVSDAQTVQRVTDSCSRRLQSDASNSGIVSGTVVPRPYSLVSVEYGGLPRRSTAGPGLESYDVELTVTSQPPDGPAQTDRRVCRVYDYDSHVDWLPAG